MTAAVPPESTGSEVSPGRTRAILAVVGLSLMAVVSAVSGLNVALPSMAIDTGATQIELTWIVDAYTVVFAGLLLFAGALGDRFGRRLLLALGLIVFGTAAGLGMLVSDPTALIAVRALMGLGAAAIMPTTLSVITTSFPEAERPRAIGVWVGIAGGGAVLGLFASGLLLEFFAWQSFFALNVALAAVALVGVLAVVPASKDDQPPALDIVGAVLSLVAVASAVYAIIEGPTHGWDDPLVIATVTAALIAGIGFVLWELRIPQPMLDPRLFRLRGFSAGSLTITIQFLAAFGFFFVAMQYLQFITGRSPLETAVAMLPLPIVLLPVARNAPLLAHRVGFRVLGPVGLALMAVGFLVFSRLEVDSPYLLFVAGIVFFALGMGLAGTPATTAITASLPLRKQGVASAVNDTARELGSALGIAILGSVLNQQYRDGMADAVSRLPTEAADRILGSVAFVDSPAVRQLGAAAQPIVDQAKAAFMVGVSNAMLAAAGILAVGIVAVFILAPRPAGAAEGAVDVAEDAAGPATSSSPSAPEVA